MKRCPQCNRVETDVALAFCRADGVALIDHSGSLAGDTPTVKSDSGPVSSEIETSLLPHTSTTPEINRRTGPTTALPESQIQGTTRDLTKPKRRGVLLVAVGVALVIIFALSYFYLSRSRTTAIKSIAVMPFVNESGNADVEYLSDGMTETLIKSLSQLPNLAVKSRGTVFYYKGKETSPKKIGEELSVQAVLLGRVVQRGDDLKLNLELVDTQTQDVIWSEQYDRKQADLVSLQSEIGRDVSSRQTIEIDPSFWYAHTHLARSIEKLGDREAAVSMLEKARSMQGSTAEPLNKAKIRSLIYQFSLSDKYLSLSAEVDLAASLSRTRAPQKADRTEIFFELAGF